MCAIRYALIGWSCEGGQPLRPLRLEVLLGTVCVGTCVHVGVSYYMIDMLEEGLQQAISY